MTLTAFIKKHQIQLSSEVFSACTEGIRQMSQSCDDMHDQAHVHSILDSLDKFIQENSQVKKSAIDFATLLLAICWHDVWKSQRLPTGKSKAILHQVAEGVGSMRIFTRETKRFHLPASLEKKVGFAIRKHSMFQIIPTRRHNLEARILQDLDKLDTWKPVRLRRGIVSLQKSNSLTPGFIRLFCLYFRYRMLPGSRKANFLWTVGEMQAWKNDFFLLVRNIITDLSGPKAGSDFFKLYERNSVTIFKRLRAAVAKANPF